MFNDVFNGQIENMFAKLFFLDESEIPPNHIKEPVEWDYKLFIFVGIAICIILTALQRHYMYRKPKPLPKQKPSTPDDKLSLLRNIKVATLRVKQEWKHHDEGSIPDSRHSLLTFKHSSKADSKGLNLAPQASHLQKQTETTGMVITVHEAKYNLTCQAFAEKISSSRTGQSKEPNTATFYEKSFKKHHSSVKQAPFATKTLAIVPSLKNSILEEKTIENALYIAPKHTHILKNMALPHNRSLLPLSEQTLSVTNNYYKRRLWLHDKSPENLQLFPTVEPNTQKMRYIFSKPKTALIGQYKSNEKVCPTTHSQDHTDTNAYCTFDRDCKTEIFNEETKPRTETTSSKKSVNIFRYRQSTDFRIYQENNLLRINQQNKKHTDHKSGIVYSNTESAKLNSQKTNTDSMHQNTYHKCASHNKGKISLYNHVTDHDRSWLCKTVPTQTTEISQAENQQTDLWSISAAGLSNAGPRYPTQNTVSRNTPTFKIREAEKRASQNEHCQLTVAVVSDEHNDLRKQMKEYNEMSEESRTVSESKTEMLSENIKQKKQNIFISREQENIHMIESLLSVTDMSSISSSSNISTEVLRPSCEESKIVKFSYTSSVNDTIISQNSVTICPSLNYDDVSSQPFDSKSSSSSTGIETIQTEMVIKDKSLSIHNSDVIIHVPSTTGLRRVNNCLTTTSGEYVEENKSETRGSATKCKNRLTNSSLESDFIEKNNLAKNSLLLCRSEITTMNEKLHKYENDPHSLRTGNIKSRAKSCPSLLQFLAYMENENKLKELVNFIMPSERGKSEIVQRKHHIDETDVTAANEKPGNIEMQQGLCNEDKHFDSTSFPQKLAQNQSQQLRKYVPGQTQSFSKSELILDSGKKSVSCTNGKRINVLNIPKSSELFKPKMSGQTINEVKQAIISTQKNLGDQAETTSTTLTSNTKQRFDLRFSKKNILKKLSKIYNEILNKERLKMSRKLLPFIFDSENEHENNVDHCLIQNTEKSSVDLKGRNISATSQKRARIPGDKTSFYKAAHTEPSVSDAVWSRSRNTESAIKDKYDVSPECKCKSIKGSIIENNRKSHIPVKIIPHYAGSYQCSETSEHTYTLPYLEGRRRHPKREQIIQTTKAFTSRKKAGRLKTIKIFGRDRVKVKGTSAASKVPLNKSLVVSLPKAQHKSLIPVRKSIQNKGESGEEREGSFTFKNVHIDPGSASTILVTTPQGVVHFNNQTSSFATDRRLKPSNQNLYKPLKKPMFKDVKNTRENVFGNIPLYSPEKVLNVIQKNSLKSQEMSRNYLVHTIDHNHREKVDSEKQMKETLQTDIGPLSSSTDRILSNKSTVSINSIERPEGAKYDKFSSYTSKYRTKDNKSLKLSWRGTIAFRKRLQHFLQHNKNTQHERNKSSLLTEENSRKSYSHRNAGVFITRNETTRGRMQNELKESKNCRDHDDFSEQSIDTSNKSPDRLKKYRTRIDIHRQGMKIRKNVERFGENIIVVREKHDVSDKCEQTMTDISSVSANMKLQQGDKDTLLFPQTARTSVDTLAQTNIDFKALSSAITEIKRRKRSKQQLKYLLQKRLGTHKGKPLRAAYSNKMTICSDTSTLITSRSDDRVILFGSSLARSETKKQLMDGLNLCKEGLETNDVALTQGSVNTVNCGNANLGINTYSSRQRQSSEQTVIANIKTPEKYEKSGVAKWDLVSCEDEDILDMHVDAAHCEFFIGEGDLIYARDITKERKPTFNKVIATNCCGLVDKTDKNEITEVSEYKTGKQDTSTGTVLPARLIKRNVKHDYMKNQLQEDMLTSQAQDNSKLFLSRQSNEATRESVEQTVSNSEIKKDTLCISSIPSDNMLWGFSNDDTVNIIHNPNLNDLCKPEFTYNWHPETDTKVASSTIKENTKSGMKSTDSRTKLVNAQFNLADMNFASDAFPEIKTAHNTSLTTDQPNKTEKLVLNKGMTRLISVKDANGQVEHRKSITAINTKNDTNESSPTKTQELSHETELCQRKPSIRFLQSSIHNTTSVDRLNDNYQENVQSSVGHHLETQQNTPHKTMLRLHRSSGYANSVPIGGMPYPNSWPIEQFLLPIPTVNKPEELTTDNVHPLSQTLADNHDKHANIFSVSSRQDRAVRKDNNGTAVADSQMINMNIEKTVEEDNRKHHTSSLNGACGRCLKEEKSVRHAVDNEITIQRPYLPRMLVNTASKFNVEENSSEQYSYCSVTPETSLNNNDMRQRNAHLPKNDAEEMCHFETKLNELDNTTTISGKRNYYFKVPDKEQMFNLSYSTAENLDFSRTHDIYSNSFSHIKDIKTSIHKSVKDIEPQIRTSLKDIRTQKVKKDKQELERVIKTTTHEGKFTTKKSVLENTDGLTYQPTCSINQPRNVFISSDFHVVSPASISLSSQSPANSSCAEYTAPGSQSLKNRAIAENSRQGGRNINLKVATEINPAFSSGSRNSENELSELGAESFNFTTKKESQNQVVPRSSRIALKGNCKGSDTTTRIEIKNQSSFVREKSEGDYSTFLRKTKSGKTEESDYGKPNESSNTANIEETVQTKHSDQTFMKLIKLYKQSLNRCGTFTEPAFGALCTPENQTMIDSGTSNEHDNVTSHKTSELTNITAFKNKEETNIEIYTNSEEPTSTGVLPSYIDKTMIEDNSPYGKLLTNYKTKRNLTFVSASTLKADKLDENKDRKMTDVPSCSQNLIKSTTDVNNVESGKSMKTGSTSTPETLLTYLLQNTQPEELTAAKIRPSRSKSRVHITKYTNTKKCDRIRQKAKSERGHHHSTSTEETTVKEGTTQKRSDTIISQRTNCKDGAGKTSNDGDERMSAEIQGQEFVKNNRHLTRKQSGKAVYLDTQNKEESVFKQDGDLESLLNEELSKANTISGIREKREVMFTKNIDPEKRKRKRRRSRKSSSPLSCHLDLYYHYLRENDGSLKVTSPNSSMTCPSDTTMYRPKRPKKLIMSAGYTKLEEFIQKAEKEMSRAIPCPKQGGKQQSLASNSVSNHGEDHAWKRKAKSDYIDIASSTEKRKSELIAKRKLLPSKRNTDAAVSVTSLPLNKVENAKTMTQQFDDITASQSLKHEHTNKTFVISSSKCSLSPTCQSFLNKKALEDYSDVAKGGAKKLATTSKLKRDDEYEVTKIADRRLDGDKPNMYYSSTCKTSEATHVLKQPSKVKYSQVNPGHSQHASKGSQLSVSSSSIVLSWLGSDLIDPEITLPVTSDHLKEHLSTDEQLNTDHQLISLKVRRKTS